jgi:hypothetical protein
MMITKNTYMSLTPLKAFCAWVNKFPGKSLLVSLGTAWTLARISIPISLTQSILLLLPAQAPIIAAAILAIVSSVLLQCINGVISLTIARHLLNVMRGTSSSTTFWQNIMSAGAIRYYIWQSLLQVIIIALAIVPISDFVHHHTIPLAIIYALFGLYIVMHLILCVLFLYIYELIIDGYVSLSDWFIQSYRLVIRTRGYLLKSLFKVMTLAPTLAICVGIVAFPALKVFVTLYNGDQPLSSASQLLIGLLGIVFGLGGLLIIVTSLYYYALAPFLLTRGYVLGQKSLVHSESEFAKFSDDDNEIDDYE